MRRQIGEERKEVYGRQRDSRERSQGSATHGIHGEIRSELNRICSVPADSANVATMRELYVRACVSNEHFHLPFSGARRCTFFPHLAPGLIPRLIAHAEQTIFFFYYFVRVRIVCFVSIKSPALAAVGRASYGDRNIPKKLNRENPNRTPSAPKFNIRKNLETLSEILARIEQNCDIQLRDLE